MAFSKVTDEELMAAATDVFRTYGYEGASLSKLSEATGLEKASLYHRFPGGKEEIALAVTRSVGAWFEQHVLQPLSCQDTPAKRVRFVSQQLRKFYRDGSTACVLDTLSLSGNSEVLSDSLRGMLTAWLDAFTRIARESGLSAGVARERAEQAVIAVEGSLVLARVLQDKRPFLKVVSRLPDLLTRKTNPPVKKPRAA